MTCEPWTSRGDAVQQWLLDRVIRDLQLAEPQIMMVPRPCNNIAHMCGAMNVNSARLIRTRRCPVVWARLGLRGAWERKESRMAGKRTLDMAPTTYLPMQQYMHAGAFIYVAYCRRCNTAYVAYPTQKGGEV